MRIYKDGIVKVDKVDDPIVLPEEVKIKVKACGVCGSDIPRVLANKAHYYPIILGHEFSGIVVETGSNVRNVKVGDHVVGAPLLPCFKCEDCQNGNYSLCKHYSFIGSRVSGAMAEYVTIPERNAVKISKNIDFIDAAFVEPITVVLHAFAQNKHCAGGSVAILGLGTMGCLAVQVAKAIGATNITVFVRNNKYNELATKLGVDNVIDTSSSDWQEKFKNVTNGRGFDFIYETAGAAQTIKHAFDIAANKARICLIGTPKTEVSFTVQQWEQINRKEFFLTGSWMSYSKEFPGEEWTQAVKYLGEGSIKILPEMIHRKVNLLRSMDLFDDYKATGSIPGRNVIVIEEEKCD